MLKTVAEVTAEVTNLLIPFISYSLKQRAAGCLPKHLTAMASAAAMAFI